MNRLVLLALALALSGLPAAAQQQAPPPHGTPRDFVLPQRETLQLDNGLAITFIDYGAVPMVTILAAVRTGNIDEGRSTWLADVTAEMMKEGTSSRSAADIARAAASMGGGLSVGAGAEQTSVAISVLSEHAADAARLVAEVLRQPRLPEPELPRIIANFERSFGHVHRVEAVESALPNYRFGDPSLVFKLDFAPVERVHLPLATDGERIDMLLSMTIYTALRNYTSQ